MSNASLFDLTGKQAVVTGGSRGIGLMIVRGLLDAGAPVVVSSRKADAVEAAVQELSAHGEVRGVAADLSREDECVRLAGEVRDLTGGPLHVLVDNAGATWGEPLETFPESAWDKLVDVLKGPSSPGPSCRRSGRPRRSTTRPASTTSAPSTAASRRRSSGSRQASKPRQRWTSSVQAPPNCRAAGSVTPGQVRTGPAYVGGSPDAC